MEDQRAFSLDLCLSDHLHEKVGVDHGYLVREYIRGLIQDVLKNDVERWELDQFKYLGCLDVEGLLVYLLYASGQFSHYYFELLLFLYSDRYSKTVKRFLRDV